jgi:hypothetical protein
VGLGSVCVLETNKRIEDTGDEIPFTLENLPVIEKFLQDYKKRTVPPGLVEITLKIWCGSTLHVYAGTLTSRNNLQGDKNNGCSCRQATIKEFTRL